MDRIVRLVEGARSEIEPSSSARLEVRSIVFSSRSIWSESMTSMPALPNVLKRSSSSSEEVISDGSISLTSSVSSLLLADTDQLPDPALLPRSTGGPRLRQVFDAMKQVLFPLPRYQSLVCVSYGAVVEAVDFALTAARSRSYAVAHVLPHPSTPTGGATSDAMVVTAGSRASAAFRRWISAEGRRRQVLPSGRHSNTAW